MKKLRLLLALVLMMVAITMQAFAERNTVSLSELRTEAANGWHQTYEIDGRSVVVDIPVQVPSVEAIPALETETLPLYTDVPDTSKMSEGYDTADHKYCNEKGFFRVDTPSQAELRAFIRSRGDEEYPRGYDMQPHIVRFNDLDWDTAYTYNLSATLRDADALMQSTLDTYFSDEKIELTPNWIYARAGLRAYDRKAGTFSGEVWEGSRAPLIVYFDQTLGGIPVITSAVEAFYKYMDVKKETAGSFHFGGIAILQDEGMPEWYTSAQFYNLLKVKEQLAQNVPLCSFATIRESCEKLINEGRLRSVESLRLGYVAWYGANDTYTLMPTWVLEGELFESAAAQPRQPATADMPAEDGSILFDAQTGEFFDPLTMPKNCAYCAPSLVD